jgi:hypothetical protein
MIDNDCCCPDGSVYDFGVILGKFLTISSAFLSGFAMGAYCFFPTTTDAAIALSIYSASAYVVGVIIWFGMTYEGWE